MQFVHPILTWGFLLALVPLLIHLINMMRHQRVQWAAMDFLLRSYKKHRKWIWLKQLILLAARVLAVLLIVAMLAQWVTRQQWLNLFGGQSTHHYVLVDDSYSMSDRLGAASAFDQARQVVSRIAARATEAETGQKLTLIRFSQAASTAKQGTDAAGRAAQIADFNAATVDSDFEVQLEQRRASFDVSQLSVGPRPALDLVRQLIDAGTKESAIVYIVSDFRTKEWERPTEARETLQQMQRSGATVQLVNCAKIAQGNLAVLDIEPADETRAAGVPLFVNVTIKNFGTAAVKKVPLKIRTTYFAPEDAVAGPSERAVGTSDELPTFILDEIKGGETITRRVQVYFPKPGQHVVEATLPDDVVNADNRRWCVVDFPESEPVLIVDGSDDQQNAYYLTAVFQPGQRARTGVQPTVQKAAYLRDATLEELNTFRVIYLLDVGRLDDRAIANLEAFVKRGGGLAWFVGDNTAVAQINEKMYRAGEGFFPAELDRADLLAAPLTEDMADLEVNDHPVFSVFLGERNSFIRLVTIEKFHKVREGWSPPAASTIQVAARLRSRDPLVVSRTYGEGRVMAFLTSLAPDWNNWAADPSFIVMLLRLQSHLAGAHRLVDERLVGEPIELTLPAEKYRPAVSFLAPGAKPGTRLLIEEQAAALASDSKRLRATLGPGRDGLAATATQRGGLFEAWSQTLAGSYEPRRYALNVDPAESDLAQVEEQQLLNNLSPVRATYHLAEQFEVDARDQSGFNRSILLMWLLIALLIAEQFLSYLLGYHPVAAGAGAGSAAGVAAARALARRATVVPGNRSSSA
ncbi:MAG: BatA domain-containing protein [Planctomycetota bacterium]